MDETTLIGMLWKALVTVGAVFFTFLFNRMSKSQDNVNARLTDAEKGLAEHRLHVSENYAKNVDVQSSLSRIHDRIDEMSTDIKTLIGKVNK